MENNPRFQITLVFKDKMKLCNDLMSNDLEDRLTCSVVIILALFSNHFHRWIILLE